MRMIRLVAVLLLIASPALAQGLGGIPFGGSDSLTQEEKEKRDAADAAYRATLRKIPDGKPVDPWGNVRTDSSTNAQPKAKVAPKRTGAAAN